MRGKSSFQRKTALPVHGDGGLSCGSHLRDQKLRGGDLQGQDAGPPNPPPTPQTPGESVPGSLLCVSLLCSLELWPRRPAQRVRHHP